MSGSTQRDRNNFSFLRLLFAVLVIVSHSPELIDGNRSREILTRMFGTLSFGDAAVDGFFLISGYLITQSLLRSRSTKDYLRKRVFRIWPGYLVAYAISLSIFAPLGGENLLSDVRHHLGAILCNAVTLQPPPTYDAFQGLPYARVDLAMWTLAYEFRAYLLPAVLLYAGILRRVRLLLLMTGCFLF